MLINSFIARASVLIGALLVSLSANSSPVFHSNPSNVLTSIDHISVSGKMYSARFTDGTYSAVFDTNPLTFTNVDDALLASTSLLSALEGSLWDMINVIPSPTMYYINGCINDASCNLLTPYADGFFSGPFSQEKVVFQSFVFNQSKQFGDNDGKGTGRLNYFYDLTAFDTFTWVIWSQEQTQPSDVPEPKTLALFVLAGAALLISQRRRNEKK